MQNIPSGMARTEPGYEELHDFKAKKAFIPSPGRVIVNADFSQLELRVAGCVANEPGIINAYRNGIDLHAKNAIISFSMQIDKSQWIKEAKEKGLTGEAFDVYVERAACKYVKKNFPDERQAAKSVSFGILYGMSKFGLAGNLNIKSLESGSDKHWEPDECGELITNFKNGYKSLTRWQNEMINCAKTQGFTYTWFGRRRYLPEINGEDWKLAGRAKRAAINTPIQSCGSDIMLLSLINMHERLDPKRYALVATVHDSCVAEVDEDYVNEYCRIAKDCMEHPLLFGKPLELTNIVPFVVEFEKGPNYGSLEPYEDF